MAVAEEILEHLRKIPETAQAEVLDFVEFLEAGHSRKGEDYDWS